MVSVVFAALKEASETKTGLIEMLLCDCELIAESLLLKILCSEQLV